MTDKLYSTDVALFATLYVVASSPEEAERKTREMIGEHGESLEFSSRAQMIGEELWMTGETFNADMPELSLSPAVSIAGLAQQELSFDLAEEELEQ